MEPENEMDRVPRSGPEPEVRVRGIYQLVGDGPRSAITVPRSQRLYVGVSTRGHVSHLILGFDRKVVGVI